MTAAAPKKDYPPATLDVALVALSWISPNTTRGPWSAMGMALKAEFGESAKDGFIDWSARGEDYNALDTVSAWKSFKGSKVGIGSLFARALAEGFKFEKSTTPVSPEKIAADKAARAARNAKAEANRIRGHAAAAVRAASQWRMAATTGESPYLVRKLVEAEACRYTADGGLILPIMDYAPDVALLRGKQAIDASGAKKYSSGMNMQGGATRLGGAPIDGADIGLAEGFATCLSIRMAMRRTFPMFVGFDAGNLVHIARVLRAKYPSSRIIIFADDDYLTKHAGQLAAQQAADAVGNALVVLPLIIAPRRATKNDESLPKLTDFNDLHCAEGVEMVAAQIMAAFAAPMVIKPAAPAASPRDEEAPAQAEQSVEDISSGVPGQGTASGPASTPCPAGAKLLVLPGDDEAPPNWQEELIHKQNGRLEDCRENVYTIMINDPVLAGVVGLDEFSMMQTKRRPPPWPHTPGEWTEDDDFSLGMFLGQRYKLVIKSNGALENAVAQAARKNKFNPVVDYLDGCVWDGIERLGTWLHHVAGVVQSPYYDLIGRLMIMSMVARAYHPGCQMDYAPVFEGGQGAGKSSLLRVLGGQWYKETPFVVGDKDGYLAIQGAWLYEIAELDSFNRGDITAIKAFITNTVDDFRAPYGRRNAKYPRRTCFAATTNQDEYLKDTTGARRFWPVRCGVINLDLLAARRDQLFAEAVILVRAGFKWHPTREEERDLIKPEQEEREIDDVWYPRIYRFVDGIAESASSATIPYLMEVTMEVLLTKALQIEIGKLSAARSESTRVGNCMTRMGWHKKRRGGGAREWYYLRPDAPAVPVVGALAAVVAP